MILTGPFHGRRSWSGFEYANKDLETASLGMRTGQDSKLDNHVILGTRANQAISLVANASDQSIRRAVRRVEWSPKVPGEGLQEALILESRIAGKLRKLDGGASTYEASIRRLALNGRLSKETVCPECHGKGIDPEFINLGEVQCAACIGTGKAPIVGRKRKLAGFYDDARFYLSDDGKTLGDRVEDRRTKTRAKAFTAKPGRKESGGLCKQRKHSWQQSKSMKWCSKCGKQSVRFKLVPA